jgi:ribonuclease D
MDCEFISNAKMYYPKLSTIQIEYAGTIVIIDTLKNNDFSLLKKILCNHKICKIMHSPYHDIEAIYSAFGCYPANIFDVQMAYAFISTKRSISYRDLVECYCNAKIDKECQRSNWMRRPLTPAQLNYSSNDVAYLRNIYENIVRNLEDKQRILWFKEELNRETKNHKKKLRDPSNHIANIVKSFRENTNNSALFQILRIRESIAANHNVHRKNVMTDAQVKHFSESIQACKTKQIDKSTLSSITNANVNHIYSEKFLKLILELNINKAFDNIILSAKNDNFSHNKLSSKESTLFNKLNILLANISEQLGISKSMIATVDDIVNSCMNNTLEDKLKFGWRYHVFGQKAAEILQIRREIKD